MDFNNRITFYIAIFVVLAMAFSLCANAQMNDRGSRGGDMMSGPPRGGDMMSGPRGGGDRGMRGGGERGGGGRSGIGRGGPRFPQEEELSESQIDRVLKQLKTHNPDKAKELEELRKTDKEKFIIELRMNAFPEILTASREERVYREYLEWSEKFVPEEAEGIRDLKEKDFDLYKVKLDKIEEKYRSLIHTRMPDELMRISVKDLQLQYKLSDLIMQYRDRRKSADQKAQLESEIKLVLGEQYDQGIKRAKYEFQQIEERIKGLQDLLEQQMNITAEMEVPEVKENAVNEQWIGISSPRRGFGGRRSSMIPSIFQTSDQNSTPAP